MDGRIKLCNFHGKKYIESDLEIQVKIKYNKCSTKEKVAGCGIA
jgi:hypothetical protein